MVYVLRFRRHTCLRYEYLITHSPYGEGVEEAAEKYIFGPFASRREAEEFINIDFSA